MIRVGMLWWWWEGGRGSPGRATLSAIDDLKEKAMMLGFRHSALSSGGDGYVLMILQAKALVVNISWGYPCTAHGALLYGLTRDDTS